MGTIAKNESNVRINCSPLNANYNVEKSLEAKFGDQSLVLTI